MTAVVLLSGGIDSAVALYWARREGHRLVSLEVEYHERPGREREASQRLAEAVGAERCLVSLPFVREAELPAAPRGYIPARNLLFYSIAAYHAEVLGASLIVGGHNRDDAARFPDARPSFFEGLEGLFAQALVTPPGRTLRVALPLAEKDKVETLRLARELGVPLEHTWSCYEDGARPCGSCPSCSERAHAFAACALKDPLS